MRRIFRSKTCPGILDCGAHHRLAPICSFQRCPRVILVARLPPPEGRGAHRRWWGCDAILGHIDSTLLDSNCRNVASDNYKNGSNRGKCQPIHLPAHSWAPWRRHSNSTWLEVVWRKVVHYHCPKKVYHILTRKTSSWLNTKKIRTHACIYKLSL